MNKNNLRKISILFSIILVMLFTVSCNTGVGDGCDESNDCDSNLVCEKNFPNGYCLKPKCDKYIKDSCPDNSQCTYFRETESTFCLEKCNNNDDCREYYSCQGVPNNKYRVCLPKKD